MSRRLLNAGDMADPASPVLGISDAQALTLQANIPATLAAQVLAGQPARVSSESAPGKSFPARVQSVGQIDPQSGLLSVRVAVFNAGGSLKIGALASCDIITARRPLAVVVPRQALLSREGKEIVFVMKGGKAQQREVQAGSEAGSAVEIRKGIKAGEKVIQLGQYELEDGAAVKLAGDDEEGAPEGAASDAAAGAEP